MNCGRTVSETCLHFTQWHEQLLAVVGCNRQFGCCQDSNKGEVSSPHAGTMNEQNEHYSALLLTDC